MTQQVETQQPPLSDAGEGVARAVRAMQQQGRTPGEIRTAIGATIQHLGLDEQHAIIAMLEPVEADEVPAPAPLPAIHYEPAERVLGVLLAAGTFGPEHSALILDKVRSQGVDVSSFPRERERAIFRAIEQVVDRGDPCEQPLVEAELEQRHDLEKAGGRSYLVELAVLFPETANAAAYARMLAKEAGKAALEREALALVEAARNGGITPQLRERLIELLETPDDPRQAPEAVGGGAFILDEPVDVDEIRLWGDDDRIGWAAGEGLMLVGPDGVGKTTLGQQLALARAGLRTELLGMEVRPDPRRVLYIAADRPRQAARSFRRMVGDFDRGELEERLTVWKGPLAAMLNDDRTVLARLAKQYDAGTIIVDSLKDVAVDVASDEKGGRIAACFQHTIALGVELLVMHHPRKPEKGGHHKPRELGDVYGSRLIFGAFGSVVMLWGDPGDILVELRHLKQPVEAIGPWLLRHDHGKGHTSIEKGTDLLDVVLAAATAGISAKDAAARVYEKAEPSRNEIERIRRRLDRLTETERLVKLPGRAGGLGGGAAEASLYVYNGPAAGYDRAPEPEELF